MSSYGDPRRDPAQQPTTAFGRDQYGRDPYARDPYAAAPPQQQPGRPRRGQYPQQNPFGTEGNEQFGITGMVLGLLGGVLLIVCFTALDWFSLDVPQEFTANFGDVGNSLSTAGFASAYFGWFAWAFAVIGVVCAVGSSFPSPALRAVRALGVVVSFAAAGLSFLALQVNTFRSYVDWLGDARAGFYLAVVGFVLVGIGAAIGPRKV